MRVGTRSAVLITATLTIAACGGADRTTSPSGLKVAEEQPNFTAAVGFGGSLLGRASSPEGFKLKRKNGKWEFDLNAKDPTDVAVQSLTMQSGGTSGWHSHPGPVVLQVTSGAFTFYEADCAPVTKTVGQLFIEEGDHAHIARNLGSTTATAIAIVFAPPGSVLRIDEQAPANCGF